VVGDVGGGEQFGIADQDACHVQGDVAVADDDGPAARQVGQHLAEVRVRVVPTHEVDRGDAARQLLAGDAQRSVRLRADRVDHRVVALGQFVGLHVPADLHVAEEPKTRVSRRLVELCADGLDLGVIGCDARAHEAPRRRQHLQHVDADVAPVRIIGGVRKLQQRGGGEVTRGAGSNDRHVVRAHSSAFYKPVSLGAQGAVASSRGWLHRRC
jgi:hypothetical protein